MPENAASLGPCVLALGPVVDQFRRILRAQFFPQYLPDWVLADEEPPSTDALWAAAQASPVPWQAVLVTQKLEGDLLLAGALGAIRLRWPTCQIAVLVAEDETPETRQLIGQLAQYQIYNVLPLGRSQPETLLELLTQTAGFEAIRPYLDPLHPVQPVALPSDAPTIAYGGIRPKTQADGPAETIVAHQTIAVVSGKGGVGKSGWIANMAIAAAPWGSVIVDADYLHPSVATYFRDPALPLEADLRQLLTTLNSRTRGARSTDWTEADRAAIRRYVEQSVTLRPGVQLIPGPSRSNPVPAKLPKGLIRELVHASVHLGRITWIDTPSLPTDDVFMDAVREADRIVCVTTPAYPAVLETIDLLRKLDVLHIPRTKLSLVITRRGKAGFSTYDLTHVHLSELPLLGVWPEDAERWERSIVTHHPMVLQRPQPWMAVLEKLTGLQLKGAKGRKTRTKPSATPAKPSRFALPGRRS